MEAKRARAGWKRRIGRPVREPGIGLVMGSICVPTRKHGDYLAVVVRMSVLAVDLSYPSDWQVGDLSRWIHAT